MVEVRSTVWVRRHLIKQRTLLFGKLKLIKKMINMMFYFEFYALQKQKITNKEGRQNANREI